MMQSKAPMYRNSKDMKEGQEEVIKIMRKFKDIGVTDSSLVWNTDLIATLELKNLLNQACPDMYGAENRYKFRGAQANEGYPDRMSSVVTSRRLSTEQFLFVASPATCWSC